MVESTNTTLSSKLKSTLYCPHFILLSSDGSHNDESVEFFLHGVRQSHPDSLVLLVFGCGADKNVQNMLSVVQRSDIDRLLLVQSSHFKVCYINSLK